MNADCYWTIEVSSGFAIRFEFGAVNIESHQTCAWDYLQIRDGLLPTSLEMVKICSSQTPSPEETSGPGAWIHFHSDNTNQDTGFNMYWTTIPDPDNCGGIRDDGEGTITSPGYPNQNIGGDTCFWSIVGVPGDQMAILITAMNIQGSDNCAYDYLELRNGATEDSPLMGRFCGDLSSDELPGELIAGSHEMWVAYVTDDSSFGSGFSANYYTSCGGTYTQNMSTLTSPGFPGTYAHSVDCLYNVVSPENNVITLIFDLFDVEGIDNGGDNICYFDWVEVRDGNEPTSPLLARKCGPQVPEPIQSSQRYMYIRFVTDASVKRFK